MSGTARQTLDRALDEAAIQATVIDLAKLRGWLVMHTRPAVSGGRWTTPIQGDPGFPDLVLARRRVVLFLEIKTEKGRLTRDQKAWGLALGGWDSALGEDDHWKMIGETVGEWEYAYAVFRPSRWDDLLEALK